jgi:hypothetical protein
MAGQLGRRRLEELIASYVDQMGRRHRIVLWGRLVLDLCPRRPAVLIAELSAGRGPRPGSGRGLRRRVRPRLPGPGRGRKSAGLGGG